MVIKYMVFINIYGDQIEVHGHYYTRLIATSSDLNDISVANHVKLYKRLHFIEEEITFLDYLKYVIPCLKSC